FKGEVRYAVPRYRTQVGNIQRARQIAATEGTPLPGHESLRLCFLLRVDSHSRGGEGTRSRIVLAIGHQLHDRHRAICDGLRVTGEIGRVGAVHGGADGYASDTK